MMPASLIADQLANCLNGPSFDDNSLDESDEQHSHASFRHQPPRRFTHEISSGSSDSDEQPSFEAQKFPACARLADTESDSDEPQTPKKSKVRHDITKMDYTPQNADSLEKPVKSRKPAVKRTSKEPGAKRSRNTKKRPTVDSIADSLQSMSLNSADVNEMTETALEDALQNALEAQNALRNAHLALRDAKHALYGVERDAGFAEPIEVEEPSNDVVTAKDSLALTEAREIAPTTENAIEPEQFIEENFVETQPLLENVAVRQEPKSPVETKTPLKTASPEPLATPPKPTGKRAKKEPFKPKKMVKKSTQKNEPTVHSNTASKPRAAADMENSVQNPAVQKNQKKQIKSAEFCDITSSSSETSPAKPSTKTALNPEELLKLTIQTLKAMCKTRNLKISGNKASLVQRLVEADALAHIIPMTSTVLQKVKKTKRPAVFTKLQTVVDPRPCQTHPHMLVDDETKLVFGEGDPSTAIGFMKHDEIFGLDSEHMTLCKNIGIRYNWPEDLLT
ncbi:hypothetical protein [Singapore grouper iridovirus]|nr:hypothetical protein [Singapore grouper iridovirus]